uniref:Uncharacterized protein n=1 Tax=Anguilla anguilla TaxID=7936 RepID=A0A0E9RPZ5_ANGAN
MTQDQQCIPLLPEVQRRDTTHIQAKHRYQTPQTYSTGLAHRYTCTLHRLTTHMIYFTVSMPHTHTHPHTQIQHRATRTKILSLSLSHTHIS